MLLGARMLLGAPGFTTNGAIGAMATRTVRDRTLLTVPTDLRRPPASDVQTLRSRTAGSGCAVGAAPADGQ